MQQPIASRGNFSQQLATTVGMYTSRELLQVSQDRCGCRGYDARIGFTGAQPQQPMIRDRMFVRPNVEPCQIRIEVAHKSTSVSGVAAVAPPDNIVVRRGIARKVCENPLGSLVNLPSVLASCSDATACRDL